MRCSRSCAAGRGCAVPSAVPQITAGQQLVARAARSPPAPGGGSLVPQTLAEMAVDADFQATAAALRDRGQAALTREEAAQRRRCLDALQLPGFGERLAAAGLPPLRRLDTTTLQLNIGLYCNQVRRHAWWQHKQQNQAAAPAVAQRRPFSPLAAGTNANAADAAAAAEQCRPAATATSKAPRLAVKPWMLLQRHAAWSCWMSAQALAAWISLVVRQSSIRSSGVATAAAAGGC
jgi:hypothetical protein